MYFKIILIYLVISLARVFSEASYGSQVVPEPNTHNGYSNINSGYSNYNLGYSNVNPSYSNVKPIYSNVNPAIPRRHLSVKLTNIQPQNSLNVLQTTEVCGNDGSFKVEDKCISIHNAEAKWNQANKFCQKSGSKLMEIQSGNFYFSLISALKKKHLHDSYWIGAIRSRRHKRWCWATWCKPIPKTFWAVTFVYGKAIQEPLEDQSENCALLDASRAHFMNPAKCFSRHKFICEKPIQANNQAGGLPYPTVPHQPNSQVGGLPYFPLSQQSPNIDVDIYFTGKENEKSALSCEPNWILNEAEKKCYNLNNQFLDFDEANNFCLLNNAALVAINSEEENIFIKELLSNYGEVTHGSYWIGLKRENLGPFTWISGEHLTHENWEDGQPDLNTENSAACDQISPSGTWSDEYCFNSAKSICEKDAEYARQVPIGSSDKHQEYGFI